MNWSAEDALNGMWSEMDANVTNGEMRAFFKRHLQAAHDATLAAAQTRITALEQALATCDGALDGVWRMSLIIESAVRNQEPARSDWISETLKRIPPARAAAKAALDE